MGIKIDMERCIGAGQCQLTAPHVFGDDEEGFSTLLPGAESHASEASVRDAADACPVRAITLTSTEGMPRS